VTDEEREVGTDLRITALVDQIDAIEAQLKVWRPTGKLIFPPLVLFLFYASLLARSDAPQNLWILMGVTLILMPLFVFGLKARRVRALEERRSKLLGQLEEWNGESSDVVPPE
jgi:hypothetical protein